MPILKIEIEVPERHSWAVETEERISSFTHWLVKESGLGSRLASQILRELADEIDEPIDTDSADNNNNDDWALVERTVSTLNQLSSLALVKQSSRQLERAKRLSKDADVLLLSCSILRQIHAYLKECISFCSEKGLTLDFRFGHEYCFEADEDEVLSDASSNGGRNIVPISEPWPTWYIEAAFRDYGFSGGFVATANMVRDLRGQVDEEVFAVALERQVASATFFDGLLSSASKLESFTSRDLAMAMNVPTNQVSGKLVSLVERGLIKRSGQARNAILYEAERDQITRVLAVKEQATRSLSDWIITRHEPADTSA